MPDNNKYEKKQEPGMAINNIEQVLQERAKLDQVLNEKFSKKMAIVFTDVCGYTAYMDKHGDILGRAWMQKHHDIVFPIIENHGGKVLVIMGDGLMCSFEDTLLAVKSCVEAQKALGGHNGKVSSEDEIHVSIGINAGKILVDNQHIAGDAVNVASRIESVAGKDEILVSEDVYEEIRGSNDILCRFHDSVSVKGKTQKLNLYRVVWRDEDIGGRVETRTRATEEEVRKITKRPASQFYLEIEKMEDGVKVGSFEQLVGETSTVRLYEEIPVSMDRIHQRCHEIVDTLNRANRQGRLNREILTNLKEIGQMFFDDLIPTNIKEKLRQTKSDHLVVNIDDYMALVPWELMHDGKEFLCQRFSMGRLVRTKQNFIGTAKVRALGQPLKMLILADPRGDLKEAYNEGIYVRDFLDQSKNIINATFLSENIEPDYLQKKIRNFDIVHFAGHMDYDENNRDKCGWRLTKGIFSAGDVIKMTGTATMPAFIFSNACQSALSDTWNLSEKFHGQIFSLASAFILSGVRHYIGTFWEILDEPSRRFAMDFYQNVLSGQSVGEALRLSRLTQIKEYGEEKITWASYMLYGDPTFNYMEQIRSVEAAEEAPGLESKSISETITRAEENVIDFGRQSTQKKNNKILITAAIASIIAIAFLGWYFGFIRTDTTSRQKEIRQLYAMAEYDSAIRACEILQKKDPNVRMSYLVEGDIYFRKGNIEEARKNYQAALKAQKGSASEQAEAYLGLGRIASINKNTDMSIDYYQKATQIDPANESGYLAQGLILDEKGQPDQALSVFEKAGRMAPDNRIIASMTGQTRKKAELVKDREKKEKIDKLVKELIDRMKGPQTAVLTNDWKSKPLTLWIMDFSTQGYSLQEAGEKLLTAGITDQMLSDGRIRLVERALLDALMEELKLGTSQLADKKTALSLGKILAARLILSGNIIYAGPQTQVSIRIIETETGKITAAANETFGSALPVYEMSAIIAQALTRKINTAYPLRGSILNSKENLAIVDIGEDAGIVKGQQFKIINSDVVLEIVSAQKEQSEAKIIKGALSLEKGQRVEQIINAS